MVFVVFLPSNTYYMNKVSCRLEQSKSRVDWHKEERMKLSLFIEKSCYFFATVTVTLYYCLLDCHYQRYGVLLSIFSFLFSLLRRTWIKFLVWETHTVAWKRIFMSFFHDMPPYYKNSPVLHRTPHNIYLSGATCFSL